MTYPPPQFRGSSDRARDSAEETARPGDDGIVVTVHLPANKLSSAGPEEPAPTVFDGRTEFAGRFIVGRGLESGAFHAPLKVPAHASVSYVDRMPSSDLRKEYPELADAAFVQVDNIDDGELLETVADESQDFIIANHFLEHCENPIGTIGVHLAKLRPGGVLFYTVPDKRYTFDHRRPVTPLDHLVGDFENGPEASRQGHYEEWAGFVDGDDQIATALDEAEVLARAKRLEEADYSIHMHVWTQAEFLELLIEARRRLGRDFEIEAVARSSLEFIVVLRKPGPVLQAPAAGLRLAWDLSIERECAVVHNDLVLTGWAMSPAGISGVIVQIDDRLFHASYGLDTAWLAESTPEIEGLRPAPATDWRSTQPPGHLARANSQSRPTTRRVAEATSPAGWTSSRFESRSTRERKMSRRSRSTPNWRRLGRSWPSRQPR